MTYGVTYGVEDVERATGIPKRTLQHWHDEGWLCASATTGGGKHRRYTEDDLRRVRIMAALRDLGFGGRRSAEIVRVLDVFLDP